MSAVVNPDLASMRNLMGWAAWATPDNESAQEQPSQDIVEETNLENDSEEEVYIEDDWEPRHIHVPRYIVWAVIALLSLGIIALAVWGLGHSTWWY